jgi:hypothetical protein
MSALLFAQPPAPRAASEFLIPPHKLVCQQIGDETILTGHLLFSHDLRGGVPDRWVRKELTQIPRDQDL